MTSEYVLLAVLLGGYSTIAVLSARAVLRERRGRRRDKDAPRSRLAKRIPAQISSPLRRRHGRG